MRHRPEGRSARRPLGAWGALVSWTAALLVLGTVAGAEDPPDVFTQDFERFARLTESRVDELRLEGVQGFCWLKDASAEPYLLKLVEDPSAEVRREVAFTLSRVGRRDSVPALLRMLSDQDPGVRQHARLALQTLTQVDDPTPGWWQGHSSAEYEQSLLRDLPEADLGRRVRALKALACLARPEAEAPLLAALTGARPPFDGHQQALALSVLERIGTPAAVPWLDSVAEQQAAAAWALGRTGGPAAEQALIKGLRRFGYWDPQHVINLDRLHSTRCGEFVTLLIAAYGCLTYRGQPENLTYDPTPLQRAATNLILRSGRGPELVDVVLREMEGRGVDAEIAPDLRPAMVGLRDELKPGFVRNDGVTTSQPMCAMSQVVRDRRLAPRLIPLLNHPAFVARAYAAMALGRLGAVEALPAIDELIEEGYPFKDPMALTSGKHFGDSQTVRWRGFLCLALGRMGGDQARGELEQLCANPDQYRDLRYCSVVGLGFIASPDSRPVLQRVAAEDVDWSIRAEAQRVLHRTEPAEADAQEGTR